MEQNAEYVCEDCGAPLTRPSPISQHFPACRWRQAQEQLRQPPRQIDSSGLRDWDKESWG